MRPLEEKQLLTQVLCTLEDPKPSVLTGKWFLPTAWVACVVAFGIAFEVGDRLGDLAMALGFALLGVGMGLVASARGCARQEPILRAHIDRESIVRRLAELEA